jgi:HlyD family secretion protein
LIDFHSHTTTMKPIRHTALALAVAAALAGAAFYARSVSSPGPVEDATPHAALTVLAETPTRQELPAQLLANGSVAAWHEASIGSESNGLRLSAVHVDIGDLVRKGQLLATFDARTVEAELAQIDAALAEAEAAAADAAAHAARARGVQGTGAMSDQQVQQLLTAEQTARARVQAQHAARQAQRLRLERTRVLAPDDGVISARVATLGAVLPAGQELFRLVRGGRLEWRAELTSADLARVVPGTAARLTAPDGTRIEGRVRSVAPTVDPHTRHGIAYVDIASPVARTGSLKAGMFAAGEFELGRSAGLTVPQAAIVMRDGFTHLFALQPDGRVRQLKVTTGRRVGGRVEVTQGVEPGTRFVTDGASFLDDGDHVKEVASRPAATLL